jgi:hypothetical protein
MLRWGEARARLRPRFCHFVRPSIRRMCAVEKCRHRVRGSRPEREDGDVDRSAYRIPR